MRFPVIDIIQDNWNQILTDIKEECEITDVSFKTWLEPLKPIDLQGTKLTVLAPDDEIQQNYLMCKYGRLLEKKVSERMGIECKIRFQPKKLSENNMSDSMEENEEEYLLDQKFATEKLQQDVQDLIITIDKLSKELYNLLVQLNKGKEE